MVEIRLATVKDLIALRELNKKVMVNNPKYDDDFVAGFEDSSDGEKFFKDMIERADGCCFVAEEDGHLVGYVNGGAKKMVAHKAKYFEIDNLGVVPEKKRQGLGTRLLEVVTEWAKERGYEQMYLNSYSKNTGALEFYRKNSFREIDVSLKKAIS